MYTVHSNKPRHAGTPVLCALLLKLGTNCPALAETLHRLYCSLARFVSACCSFLPRRLCHGQEAELLRGGRKGRHQDAVVLVEAIHLVQQLQQPGLALARPSVAAPLPARLADRIDLVCARRSHTLPSA